MLKTIYQTTSLMIPREELTEAAKEFLVNSGLCKALIPADNIRSPKFGVSDLLFVNSGRTTLTVVRLNGRNYGESCEKFIISSISYYFWLRQFITVSEVCFSGKCKLEMYLFSDGFSAPVLYLIDNLPNESPLHLHLIKYNVLDGEGLDEPAIYFQHMSSEDHPQDSAIKNDGVLEAPRMPKDKEAANDVEISPQELHEFNRLKALYLG
jgi:hypothetical protein